MNKKADNIKLLKEEDNFINKDFAYNYSKAILKILYAKGIINEREMTAIDEKNWRSFYEKEMEE